MNNTDARTRVYDLLRQASSNSNFDTDVIDSAVNQGRRLFATLVPDGMIPNLQDTSTNLVVASGLASFPSDYLRQQKDGLVKIDSVYADELKDVWRLKFLESNDNAKSSSTVKRYRLRKNGIEVYPTNATAVDHFDYIKVPSDLDGNDNTELPKWGEDFSIDFAFERLNSTDDGDLDIAVKLMKERGINVTGAIQNVYV